MQNEEPQFLEGLRFALANPSPAALIESASMLAALEQVADDDASELRRLRERTPGSPYPNAFAVLELAPVLVESDAPETNAVLRVWAEMLGDDMLRRRVRNSVSTRDHPAWLDALDHAAITRAIAMGDHFGEEETVMLEVQVDGHAFTMACALQHLGMTSLDDAYLLPLSASVAFGDLPAEVATRTVMRDLELGRAKHLIAQAVEYSDRMFPPVETDSWPATKPALEWLLRLIPDDPEALAALAYDPQEEEAKERERDLLADDFLASPEGQALPAQVRKEIDLVLEFQHNYGTGDALRWGPQFVEYLMLDLYPRKYAAPDRILLQLPRLLTAVVQWANARSGMPAEATRGVLKLIKDLTPEYREIIKDGGADPFPFGAGALSDPAFLNSLDLGALMAPPVDDFGDDPAFEAAFEAAELAAYLRSIPPQYRESFARADSPDAALGEDPLQDFLLESFPSEQPDFGPALIQQFTLHMLEREVGGAQALAALDAAPLPHPDIEEALDRSDVPVDLRPRLRRIGAIIIARGGQLFNGPELVTAALRVLARAAASDPALFRRHSKDANTAAAACWIAAWLNEWLDPYGGSGRTAKALGAAFGMKSAVRTRAETLVRAMGAQVYTRSGDFFLGDAGLFVSRQRSAMVSTRDAFSR